MARTPDPTLRVVCLNRKARFDYELLDRHEAGLVLSGSEVKALREGKGNLVDAWVSLKGGVARVMNFEISSYSHDRSNTSEPRRSRLLLLHEREIKRLAAAVKEKGLTLIPVSVYFKGPWAKLEISLARGRQKGDKRQALRKREAQRDIDRLNRHRR